MIKGKGRTQLPALGKSKLVAGVCNAPNLPDLLYPFEIPISEVAA